MTSVRLLERGHSLLQAGLLEKPCSISEIKIAVIFYKLHPKPILNCNILIGNKIQYVVFTLERCCYSSLLQNQKCQQTHIHNLPLFHTLSHTHTQPAQTD